MYSNPPRIPAWEHRSHQLLRYCTPGAVHTQSDSAGSQEAGGSALLLTAGWRELGSRGTGLGLTGCEAGGSKGYKDVQNNPMQI